MTTFATTKDEATGVASSQARIALDEPPPRRVMLDASVLLSIRDAEWLGDPEIVKSIVIPAAVADLIARGRTDVLRQFAPPRWPGLSPPVRAIAESVPTFTASESELPSDEARRIVAELRSIGAPGTIYADEYAYLVSQSWLAAVGDAFNRTLAAIRHAKVTVEEVRNERLRAFQREARKVIPPAIFDGLKAGRGVFRAGYTAFRIAGTAKVLLVAGGFAVPPLIAAGITVGTVAGAALAGTALVVGDP